MWIKYKGCIGRRENGGTGYADESGHGDSGLEYMRKLFNRNK